MEHAFRRLVSQMRARDGPVRMDDFMKRHVQGYENLHRTMDGLETHLVAAYESDSFHGRSTYKIQFSWGGRRSAVTFPKSKIKLLSKYLNGLGMGGIAEWAPAALSADVAASPEIRTMGASLVSHGAQLAAAQEQLARLEQEQRNQGGALSQMQHQQQQVMEQHQQLARVVATVHNMLPDLQGMGRERAVQNIARVISGEAIEEAPAEEAPVEEATIEGVRCYICLEVVQVGSGATLCNRVEHSIHRDCCAALLAVEGTDTGDGFHVFQTIGCGVCRRRREESPYAPLPDDIQEVVRSACACACLW